MKLNSMILYIDDRFPELEDFRSLQAKGNSRFWKGDYLYVVEQEMLADRFYWLYLQYDNANLYAPHVVDIADDSVKDNPRPKNQMELRNQLFACYDLKSRNLYVSNYQKKAAITYFMGDTLQKPVEASEGISLTSIVLAVYVAAMMGLIGAKLGEKLAKMPSRNPEYTQLWVLRKYFSNAVISPIL